MLRGWRDELLHTPARAAVSPLSVILRVAEPVIARLSLAPCCISALCPCQPAAWVNGQLTDDHELGTFTTFEKRVLYDVVDVTALMFQGCNTLGVMVGHGWFAQPSVNSGPRQFLAMLSVTTADGATTYYPSAASSSSPTIVSASAGGALRAGASIVPLTFTATAGPVTQDDIYVGENYDGRIAASLAGWSTCEYKPQLSTNWTAPVVAAKSPASFNSIISAHNVAIRTDQDYAVVPGGPYSPGPGQCE